MLFLKIRLFFYERNGEQVMLHEVFAIKGEMLCFINVK